MQFESLVRLKALSLRYQSANPQLRDHLMEQQDVAEKLGLQKVQFLVSQKLKEDLQSVCDYLNMTQREFLESMLSEALEKTWKFIEQEEATPEELGYSKGQ